MLSYQHAFHSGNHADILKHIVLIYTLNHLNKKEKPYTFFDTHAGSGLYDLNDERLLKTNEAEEGIKKLFLLCKNNFNNLPQALNDYLCFVNSYVENNLYPGSPEIEKNLIRKNDVLVLSELHPQEIENLKKNMNSLKNNMDSAGGKNSCMNEQNCKNVNIHKRNGWEMIQALTPPKTVRGGVLIDPSYEEAADYVDAAETICRLYKKWNSGIILLWYPLLTHRKTECREMLNKITNCCRTQNQNVEISNLILTAYPEGSENKPRLYGSGMFIVNSPYLLQEKVEEALKYVSNVMGFCE